MSKALGVRHLWPRQGSVGPASGLLLAVLLLLVACGETTTTLPGDITTLRLQVAFTDISQPELQSIASFQLIIEAAQRYEIPVSFNSSDKTFIFTEDPLEDLPTQGEVTVQLKARDTDDLPLPMGGRTGTISLDDGSATIPILVNRLDAFTLLPATLAQGRFLHTATSAGGGILVVGGSTTGDPDAPGTLAANVEWLNPFSGQTCHSGDTCATWGEVPGPRIHHIALSLVGRFDSSCSLADRVLVGLGQNNAGTALNDLYLFDPATVTFEALGVSVQARIGASVYATADCRVVILGGHDTGFTTALDVVDVLDFETPTVQHSSEPSFPNPTAFGVVAYLDNALDEVLIAGGETAVSTPSTAATTATNANGQLAFCDVADGACNGTGSPLLCARSGHQIVKVDSGNVLSPMLVLGDATAACAGQNTSLFRAGLTDPVFHFIPTANQPITARSTGHSAFPTGTSAIVAGGIAVGQSTPNAKVERFSLEAGFTESDLEAAGVFEAMPDLAGIRSHAASTGQNNVFLVGGWSGSGALNTIEVFTGSF